MHVALGIIVVGLRAVLQRLAKVIAGRQPLGAAQSGEVHISVVPRDVTTRFGLTSLTLATSQVLEVEFDRDPVGLLR